MADIKIVYQDPENLREYQNNPRYNDDAVKAVAESIKEFGFKNPIIVDKTNYAVMSMPSAVKISMLNSTHKRIHHKISWNNCVPKIISEKYRKEG